MINYSKQSDWAAEVRRATDGKGVDLVLDANEAHAEVVEFLKGGQKVAGGAGEAVEFPDQDAIDFAIADARHQSVEPGAPLAAA